MTLPKLNLRDLFWLVLVVAMGLGWTIECRRRTSEKVQHAREVATLNGELGASRTRLMEAEDLLSFEGVDFGDGTTIHTTPERAMKLLEERRKRQSRNAR